MQLNCQKYFWLWPLSIFADGRVWLLERDRDDFVQTAPLHLESGAQT